jgi:hypothetical protein
MVSGGLFNRAEGLWEEMDADLYAATPLEALLVASEENRLPRFERRTINRRRKRRQLMPQNSLLALESSAYNP